MRNSKANVFLPMILAIVLVVISTSMFSTIMTYLTSLADATGASSLTIYVLLVRMAPTLLLLGLLGMAGALYIHGYGQMSSGNVNGLMMGIFGIIQLVLFLALFSTVASSFITLFTTYGGNATWVAFGVVVSIVPAILFLAGIGSAIAVGVQCVRKGKKALSK